MFRWRRNGIFNLPKSFFCFCDLLKSLLIHFSKKKKRKWVTFGKVSCDSNNDVLFLEGDDLFPIPQRFFFGGNGLEENW